MATVTAPSRAFDRDDTQRRVRHPLQALRKYIRLYVVLEGLAVAFLYLALWFWIGLALDYGLFLMPGIGFDWVQELNYAFPAQSALIFRAVILGLLVAGLIALVGYKIGLRFMKEFRDASLALVLERRFPRELGDRLITAVELADPAKGKKYGFSQVMIEKTITEAAERVEKLPVTQVFNWGRLYKLGLWCVLLTVGLYLAVGAATCGLGAITGGSTSPVDYVYKFNDVAQTWVERNILLMNSYWPRNAFLEVVRFQDTEDHRNEMRVGRDEQRPDVQVRAIEWVVADRESADGWRALRWGDLPDYLPEALLAKVSVANDPAVWGAWIIDLDDLSADVPAGFIPLAWQNKTAAQINKELDKGNYLANFKTAGLEQHIIELIHWQSWTVDRLKLQLAKKAVKERLIIDHQQAYEALQRIFVELEEVAANPRFSRKLRKLDIPKDVSVYYRGDNTKSSSTHEWQPDNKYSVGLNELKESVRFTVRGGDYYTPYKKITLVPPPHITGMLLDKEEPAYRYYWLQGEQADLKGKKQIYKDEKVSVTGDRSTIVVPYGADLVLYCSSDRPLKKGIRLRAPQAADATGQALEIPVQHEDLTDRFSITMKNVQKTQEFNFEFNDADNVKGKRRIKIQPEVDAPPDISKLDLAVVLRRPRLRAEAGKGSTGAPIDGYLVTPDARLPFHGVVKDDIGLTRLEWAFEVEQVQIELFGPSAGKAPPKLALLPLQTRIIAGGNLINPGPLSDPLRMTVYWAVMGRILEADLAKNVKKIETQYANLTGFADDLQRREHLRKNVVELPELLRTTPDRKISPFIVQHDLKDREEFNFGLVLPRLKVRDPQKEGQLHYLVKLAVSATDNNLETGNDELKFGSTRRSEPAIPLLVVSETELLTQVALEEEVISERMDKVLFKLRAAQTTLSEQIAKLSMVTSDLSLIALRTDEVRKFLMDGSSNTKEMLNDYLRIFTELRVNQVREEKLVSVEDKIVRKLEAILHPTDGNFVVTEDAVGKVLQALEDDVNAKRDDNRPAHLKSAEQANGQLNLLIAKLNEVSREMAQGVDWARALDSILNIERIMRVQVEMLTRYHGDRLEELFNNLNLPK